MRLLTLALFFFLPNVAQASPWFDKGTAEQMVAQVMPEYYEYLSTTVAQNNPEKYDDKLHKALVMVVNVDVYPEMVDLWNRKWQTEMRFREQLADWKAATPDNRNAIREDMLITAEQIQALSLEIFQIKYSRGHERLDRMELQMADLEMNQDMMALERVMGALREY